MTPKTRKSRGKKLILRQNSVNCNTTEIDGGGGGRVVVVVECDGGGDGGKITII